VDFPHPAATAILSLSPSAKNQKLEETKALVSRGGLSSLCFIDINVRNANLPGRFQLKSASVEL